MRKFFIIEQLEKSFAYLVKIAFGVGDIKDQIKKKLQEFLKK